MKIGIMQPYFFPYVGYYQLMNAVDEYVVYDNIEFTKKGWINRNRILVNGADAYITLPLKNDSDFLPVNQRYLADSWPVERNKILNRIRESYRKAPHFESVFPVIERCVLFGESNLFAFLYNSLNVIKDHLGIDTRLVISSEIPVDHTLKSEEKVLEICKARNAATYVNPIGGVELYDKSNFSDHHIELQFLQSLPLNYRQFNHEHVPWLSIVDVMMFNSPDEITDILNKRYTLV